MTIEVGDRVHLIGPYPFPALSDASWIVLACSCKGCASGKLLALHDSGPYGLGTIHKLATTLQSA